MTRARLRGGVLAATSVALAAATGCSSSGGAQPAGTALTAAMASVSGSGPASVYFEFGDLARLRALHVLNPDALQGTSETLSDPQWSGVVGVGAGSLGTSAVLIADATGIDLYSADTAVSIGMPPNHATKIVGSWDVKAITAKLAGLGARPRGFGKTTGLSFAADNQVNLDSKLTEQTQVSTDFDQMVVTDQQIATSPNSAALQKALDPGKALLDAAAYGKLAGCLGDVVAAIVMKPTGASHSTLVGVGVRDPASAAATQHEVLCIQPASGRQSSVHRAVQRSLAPAATDPTTRAPVSTHVAATQVHDASGLVQAVLTMQPDTQLGYLIDGLQRGSSRYWDGSCAVTSGAPRC